MSLNTLELLVAEKIDTAGEVCGAICSAVALPIDEILNDAVTVMERYIGHESEVGDRLREILRNARDIKQVIQAVAGKMAPIQVSSKTLEADEHPNLRGRRILVAHADEDVRSASHTLLGPYRCAVETARHGAEALAMVRSMTDGHYDVIIADVRLPDMNGYELLLKLKEVIDPVPLVLMTGSADDSADLMAKVREAGLLKECVLQKPIQLDRLLRAVECLFPE